MSYATPSLRRSGLAAACAAVLMVALAPSPASADDRIVAVKSNASVSETIDRLASAIEAKGITVFARVDHAAGAKSAGMDMRPSQLLIFGNPKLGTPLMQSNPLIGLDLPMKALAWEAEDGTVYLTYTAPTELKARYDIENRDEVFAKMSSALKNLTEKATGASD